MGFSPPLKGKSMKKLSETIIEILVGKQKVSRTKIITKYGPALDAADLAHAATLLQAIAPVVEGVEDDKPDWVKVPEPKDVFTQPSRFETVAGRTGYVAVLQSDLAYKSGLVSQKEKELDNLVEAKRKEISDLESEVSLLHSRIELAERTPIKGCRTGMDIAASVKSEFMRWAGH